MESAAAAWVEDLTSPIVVLSIRAHCCPLPKNPPLGCRDRLWGRFVMPAESENIR